MLQRSMLQHSVLVAIAAAASVIAAEFLLILEGGGVSVLQHSVLQRSVLQRSMLQCISAQCDDCHCSSRLLKSVPVYFRGGG